MAKFIGSEAAREEAAWETVRNLEALECRVKVLTELLGQYALRIVELETLLREAELKNVRNTDGG